MSKSTKILLKESESLPQSLMFSAANEYTLSTLTDFAESLLDDVTDAVFESDIATKIPVIGGLVAMGKGMLILRDRRYANKLVYFLTETSKASKADKEKFRQKLNENPKECKKAGEVLMDILDKVTSIEKAIMLGKVVRASMNDPEVTFDHVITLSEMIEKAYLKDLTALSKGKKNGIQGWDDTHLESVGIKKPMRVEDVNSAIDAAISQLKQETPALQDRSTQNGYTILYKPEIVESGFTDMGSLLVRILQEY